MRKRNVLGAVTALTAVATILTGCVSATSSPSETSTAGGADSPLIIGVVMDGSSFMSAFDLPTYEAMQIEAERLNAEGGIGGRSIEFDFFDTGAEAAQYTTGAQQVIADGAEIIVTTCDYDIAAPAAVVAEAAGILNLSCSSDTLYGPAGGLSLGFALSNGTPGEASTMAEFANDQGWGTAAIIADSTLKYTTNQCLIAKQRWEALGGTVTFEGSYVQGDSITEVVSQISAAGQPDVIFHCGYNPGGGQVVKDLRDGGITSAIVSGNSMDGDYWTGAIPGLSDHYSVTQVSNKGDDPNEAVNELLAAYTERTGAAPSTSSFVVGAAIIEAIAAAYEIAGTFEGAAMTAAMEGFDEEELVNGPTTFREGLHISVDRPTAIMQITDGTAALREYRAPEEVVFLE